MMWLILFSSHIWATTLPNQSLTPGVLCSVSNPQFKELRYAEKVPYCQRKVDLTEKLSVAASYGHITRAEWPKYEFDHLIPLCAGGANDQGNLWPQPIGEAHEKDKVEDFVCSEMRAGRIKQAEAVKQIRDWFKK